MSSIFCPVTTPTVVEHSISAIFIERSQTNLIVARNDLLQIFRLHEREEDLKSSDSFKDEEVTADTDADRDDFIGASMSIQTSERQIVSRLLLVAQYSLYGSVLSLGTIRAKDFAETGIEHVLVSFESAKASLLRWDHDQDSVVTVSLHSFMREEYRSPLSRQGDGVMRVDPLSRVATMSFAGDRLAFMPISQQDELLMDEQQDEEHVQGPISKSFVLSVTQLQDDITEMKSFSFVDGYREPAIAILYSTEGTAPGLLENWRKDTTKLVILTLDLQAGARTAIFEINDLPSTLTSVSAIPGPLGGCLLLGSNEVIYVDSASRVVALALNPYAKKSSSLPMRDYSSLNLQLEGCLAVALQHKDDLDGILLILSDGRLCLLTLNLDGRTVSSLHLKIVTPEFGGSLVTSGANCATILEGQRIFIGSTTGDSKLLAWRKRARSSGANGSAVLQEAILDVQDGEQDDIDDLQDLYGDETNEKKLFGAEKTVFDLRFYLHDTVLSHGSITGMALGAPYTDPEDDRQEDIGDAAELAVVGGAGKAGKLTIFRRRITPEVIGKFESPDWQALWTVKVRHKTTEVGESMSDSLDAYLVASKDTSTQVFTIDAAFIEKTDSEFETSDATVSVDTLLDHRCIVQICADMMRTYDAELKLLELKPTPEECTIISASIVDPYVLLVLDNAQLALYSISAKTQELEEIQHEMNSAIETVCATLYCPRADSGILYTLLDQSETSKKRKRSFSSGSSASVACQAFCFTINAEGCLSVYLLPSMKLVFRSSTLSQLPEILLNDSSTVNVNGTGASTSNRRRKIVEVLVGDLGHRVPCPYLVLRTSDQDLVLYKPFHDAQGCLRFRKEQSYLRSTTITTDVDVGQHIEKAEGETKVLSPIMTLCANVGGYACIFVKREEQPLWLLQTDHSIPIFHAAGMLGVRSLSGFNTRDARQGFIYCDHQSLIRICQLPEGFDYSNRWSSKALALGRSAHSVAYHAPQQAYLVLTSHEERFEIPDEEDEEWEPLQSHSEQLPLLSRGSLELVDACTFKLMDRYELAENEQGLCLKSVSLTISTDYTKKKRSCLALSTGILRGEDLSMRGAVYVFDVVEVVPETGHPDSKYKIKNVCREEVRAAATTLCEVDGYLLSSQGQKVVVRSLEEDERLTPVAFVDLDLATTTAKCLRSMILFGDIQKGLRFVGFGEEPYKMTNFGRDFEAMDVMDAEFLVDGKNLYFVASDSDANLRVLQYDPENPTTLAGSRLIRRADIHAGRIISSMVLLPQQQASKEDGQDQGPERSVILCAALDGSISAIMPITERSYRRLYTVQVQLSATEVQIAGLNPRAYRLCTTEGLTTNAARGILDGQLLNSFVQLDVMTQTRLGQKSGVGSDNVLVDLAELQKAVLFQ